MLVSLFLGSAPAIVRSSFRSGVAGAKYLGGGSYYITSAFSENFWTLKS